jgi:hypothetical protein
MDLTSKKFEHIHFPHILFFGLIQTLELKDRILIYKGGEDHNLIVGKEYVIEERNYSPNKETPRVAVWTCKDENNKIVIIDKNNFVTLIDFRNSRIDNIIN